MINIKGTYDQCAHLFAHLLSLLRYIILERLKNSCLKNENIFKVTFDSLACFC